MVSPSAVGSIAAKIGLRTSANGPVVTSCVRSSGSTPIRQLAPIATCAQKVKPIPAIHSAEPGRSWARVRFDAKVVERGDRRRAGVVSKNATGGDFSS
jgi:hypothetical protein